MSLFDFLNGRSRMPRALPTVQRIGVGCFGVGRRKRQLGLQAGLERLERKILLAADVVTNHSDYPPGATALIAATGFQEGETVELEIDHIDARGNVLELGGDGHEPWSVTDGEHGDLDGLVNGEIHTTWYVNPDDSLNETFRLTARGLASSKLATWTFTDSDHGFSETSLWPGDDVSLDEVMLDPNANVKYADLDADGQVDIVTFGCVMRVYWANGEGGYTEAVVGEFDTCEQGQAYGVGDLEIELADSDGDGDLDIYATNQTNLYVLKNEDSVFMAPDFFGHAGDRQLSYRGHHPIGAGDLNGDQIADLLVVDFDIQNGFPVLGVRIVAETLFQDQIVLPTQGFLSMPFLEIIRDIEVVDVNADELLDIVVVGWDVDSQQNHIITFTNSGGGPFERSTLRLPATSCVNESEDLCYTNQIEVGDVDGDGFPDLVVPLNGQLQVWHGMSPGDQATVDQGTDFASNVLHVVDVDSDGRDDIVAKSTTNGNIVWFKSLPTKGEFETRELLLAAGEVPSIGDEFPQWPLAAADLDGDSDTELFVLESAATVDEFGVSTSGAVLTVLEPIPEAIPGDVNGDEAVNFNDFLILSTNFGRTENVSAADGDLDGNGEIDFLDFLILATNFNQP